MIQFNEAVAELAPGQALFFLADALDQLFAQCRALEVAGNGFCDGFGVIGGHHQAGVAVGNGFAQSSDIGSDHRYFEVVGHRTDAALGGTPVGQYTQVGGREIGTYAGIRNVGKMGQDPILQPVLPDEPFVFVEASVRFASNDQLVTFIQVMHGLQQQVQPFVLPDQPEKQQGAFVGVQPEGLLGPFARKAVAEMGVERVRGDDGPRIGMQGFEVLVDRITEGDEGVVPVQVPARQGLVEEMRLVGNDVVHDGNHFAAGSHVTGYPSLGGSKVRHPVAHYQQIRSPGAYGLGRTDVGKRIGRIQQRGTRYGYGLIIRGYKLRLPRKQKVRVLAFEVESSH